MKQRIITILLMAAAVVGCSKSDIPGPSTLDSYEPSTTPISFQTEDNWGDDESRALTRGTAKDGDFVSGDEIGVYTYYLPAGEQDYTAASANFMRDQKVTKQADGSWEYSPVKYWPLNGSLSFFAYWPYNANRLSITDAGGKPRFTYKIPTVVSNQKDLLIAKPKVYATNATTAASTPDVVLLEFQHALACINFTGSVTSAMKDPVKITQIDIKNLKSIGTFCFDDSNALKVEDLKYEYDKEKNIYSYTLNPANNFMVDRDIKDILESQTDKPSLLTEKGHPMVIPQTVDATAVIEVEFISGNPAKTKTVNLELNKIISEFEAGKIYTINILIVEKLIDVTFTATAQDWRELKVDVPSFN